MSKVKFNAPLKPIYRSSDLKRFSNGLKYRGMGYSDYIAARILLRNELPKHGVVMAGMAIEKYFKAVLSMCGEKVPNVFGKIMIRQIKNSVFEHSKLNSTFINWLSDMSVMRNYDNIPKNFTSYVSRNNTLAELDRTINVIDQLLTFEKNGEVIKSEYQANLESKEPFLCSDNWLALDITQKEYVERLDKAFYMSREQNGNIQIISIASESGHGIYKNNFYDIKPGLAMLIKGKGVASEEIEGEYKSIQT